MKQIRMNRNGFAQTTFYAGGGGGSDQGYYGLAYRQVSTFDLLFGTDCRKNSRFFLKKMVSRIRKMIFVRRSFYESSAVLINIMV